MNANEDGEQSSIIQTACFHHNLNVVKMLLEKGVDVNIVDKVVHGQTRLHWASSQGYLELVKLLVGHGADVDANDYM
jgi:ankyrin repeat protein